MNASESSQGDTDLQAQLGGWARSLLARAGNTRPASTGAGVLQAASRRSMAISTGATLALLHRVADKAEGSRVWRPEAGPASPQALDRFAAGVAGRYQLNAQKYLPQAAERNKEQESELVLALPGSTGGEVSREPGAAEVVRETVDFSSFLSSAPPDEARGFPPLPGAGPAPQPVEFGPPPWERQAGGPAARLAQRRAGVRPISRVEEITPGGRAAEGAPGGFTPLAAPDDTGPGEPEGPSGKPAMPSSTDESRVRAEEGAATLLPAPEVEPAGPAARRPAEEPFLPGDAGPPPATPGAGMQAARPEASRGSRAAEQGSLPGEAGKPGPGVEPPRPTVRRRAEDLPSGARPPVRSRIEELPSALEQAGRATTMPAFADEESAFLGLDEPRLPSTPPSAAAAGPELGLAAEPPRPSEPAEPARSSTTSPATPPAAPPSTPPVRRRAVQPTRPGEAGPPASHPPASREPARPAVQRRVEAGPAPERSADRASVAGQTLPHVAPQAPGTGEQAHAPAPLPSRGQEPARQGAAGEGRVPSPALPGVQTRRDEAPGGQRAEGEGRAPSPALPGVQTRRDEAPGVQGEGEGRAPSPTPPQPARPPAPPRLPAEDQPPGPAVQRPADVPSAPLPQVQAGPAAARPVARRRAEADLTVVDVGPALREPGTPLAVQRQAHDLPAPAAAPSARAAERAPAPARAGSQAEDRPAPPVPAPERAPAQARAGAVVEDKDAFPAPPLERAPARTRAGSHAEDRAAPLAPAPAPPAQVSPAPAAPPVRRRPAEPPFAAEAGRPPAREPGPEGSGPGQSPQPSPRAAVEAYPPPVPGDAGPRLQRQPDAPHPEPARARRLGDGEPLSLSPAAHSLGHDRQILARTAGSGDPAGTREPEPVHIQNRCGVSRTVDEHFAAAARRATLTPGTEPGPAAPGATPSIEIWRAAAPEGPSPSEPGPSPAAPGNAPAMDAMPAASEAGLPPGTGPALTSAERGEPPASQGPSAPRAMDRAAADGGRPAEPGGLPVQRRLRPTTPPGATPVAPGDAGAGHEAPVVRRAATVPASREPAAGAARPAPPGVGTILEQGLPPLPPAPTPARPSPAAPAMQRRASQEVQGAREAPASHPAVAPRRPEAEIESRGGALPARPVPGDEGGSPATPGPGAVPSEHAAPAVSRRSRPAEESRAAFQDQPGPGPEAGAPVQETTPSLREPLPLVVRAPEGGKARVQARRDETSTVGISPASRVLESRSVAQWPPAAAGPSPDQPLPLAVLGIQRQPATAGVGSGEVAPLAGVVQRVLVDAGVEQQPGPSLEELARQVYPLVKRLLAVERERLPR